MNTLSYTQQICQDEAHRFAQEVVRPTANALDETGEFPWDWFRKCGELGLIGTEFPVQYGGKGFGSSEAVVMLEEISHESGALAAILCAHTHAAHMLARVGSEKQKQTILARALRGECVLSFAITEESGSANMLGLETTATRDGNEWILNGAKRWVLNAEEAQVYLIAARTGAEKNRRGITLFAVDRGTPGLTTERIPRKMGIHNASTCNLRFDNCRIPIENKVGESSDGYSLSQIGVNDSALHYSAVSVGMAQGALDRCLAFTKQRQCLDRPIVSYQSLAFALAEMQTKLAAARSMLYDVARTAQTEKLSRIDVNMLRLFTTEVCCEICDRAMQIFGGNGYSAEYEIERFVRDSRVLRVVSGTSEMSKIAISNKMIASMNP